MKYILMCGGNYPTFKKKKQLLEVNGEVLVERTIRLLKENNVKDIVISTNCSEFDYLGLPILIQKNKYINHGEFENKKSESCWLNAYYQMEEPCCYIHGDVYFSDEAIKTIVETPVKDTMFFCVRDIGDGRPTGINAKGREPLAYKVQNYKLFNNSINDILRMVDEGKFKNVIAPFSWHLYRYINGLEYISNNLGFINNIFDTKGDYTVIDDYSTDVDNIEDVETIEMIIKMMEGGVKMIKVEVIESFTLGKFNELKNIIRAKQEQDVTGTLYVGDTFDCTEEMVDYLTETNKEGRAFVKILDVPVEKPTIEEKPKKYNMVNGNGEIIEAGLLKEDIVKKEITEDPKAGSIKIKAVKVKTNTNKSTTTRKRTTKKTEK